MNSLRRLLAPLVLVLALLGALAFAATAAAETKVGEATSPVDTSIPGEVDLLNGTAKYDSATGIATFTATTRQAVGSEGHKEVEFFGALLTTKGGCSAAEVESSPPYPVFGTEAPVEGPVSIWFALENDSESPGPETEGSATKVSNGATPTIIAASAKAVSKPYNCAEVGVGEGTGAPLDYVVFPISVPPAPTPAPAPVVPAPAALSLAKPKGLQAKAGKWVNAKVTITNTGGTAVGPVAIKATAPKGVTIRPGKLTLPALLPGQSWTTTIQVKLGATAKSKSTISLTGSSGSLSVNSSFVAKLAG